MKGINKCIIVGTLGKDPELKSFDNGGSIANVSAATTEKWKGKDGTEQSRTDWHNLVFSNKLAEVASKYLRKGSKVYVEGSLRTRKWTDKEGKDHYTTEIHVRELQMLDGKPQEGQQSAPKPSAAAANAQAQGGRARQAEVKAFDDPSFDSETDIPF